MVERRLCKADARGSYRGAKRRQTHAVRPDGERSESIRDPPPNSGLSASVGVLLSGLALLTVGNGGKGTLPWRFAESSGPVNPGKFGLLSPRQHRG